MKKLKNDNRSEREHKAALGLVPPPTTKKLITAYEGAMFKKLRLEGKTVAQINVKYPLVSKSSIYERTRYISKEQIARYQRGESLESIMPDVARILEKGETGEPDTGVWTKAEKTVEEEKKPVEVEETPVEEAPAVSETVEEKEEVEEIVDKNEEQMIQPIGEFIDEEFENADKEMTAVQLGERLFAIGEGREYYKIHGRQPETVVKAECLKEIYIGKLRLIDAAIEAIEAKKEEPATAATVTSSNENRDPEISSVNDNIKLKSCQALIEQAKHNMALVYESLSQEEQRAFDMGESFGLICAAMRLGRGEL